MGDFSSITPLVWVGAFYAITHIEQCPINLECAVEQIVDLESHCLVLGRVVQTHISQDSVSSDGSVDFVKVNPVTFLDKPTRKYMSLGTITAEAFSVGLEL